MKIIGKLSETDPEAHAAFKTWSESEKRKRGRPLQGSKPKVVCTVRLDADVVDRMRATPNWQRRLNDVAREAFAPGSDDQDEIA
jgi:uncharacterized protein (DUF4415 family)